MPRDGLHELNSVVNTWFGMRQRCNNPNNPQYKDYGARGIVVRWATIHEFFADVGPRPPGLTIDRINNDGDYAPGNVRWATRAERQYNRRKAVYVEIEGQTHRLHDLAKQSGIGRLTIAERAKRGLSMAEVLSKGKLQNLSGLSLGGSAFAAKMRERTHCRNRHEYTPENTLITPEGWRRCRTCHRLSHNRKV